MYSYDGAYHSTGSSLVKAVVKSFLNKLSPSILVPSLDRPTRTLIPLPASPAPPKSLGNVNVAFFLVSSLYTIRTHFLPPCAASKAIAGADLSTRDVPSPPVLQALMLSPSRMLASPMYSA